MGPLLRDSPPDEAVSLHGGLTVTRVMISGQLGGRLAKLRMSPVCNPPPALGRAVQTIYVATFQSRAHHQQFHG